MRLDANRDVVVQAFTLVDALTGDAIGERWSVWIGPDNEGSFDSEGEALAAALAIAEQRGLPAWLMRDDGGAISLVMRAS